MNYRLTAFDLQEPEPGVDLGDRRVTSGAEKELTSSPGLAMGTVISFELIKAYANFAAVRTQKVQLQSQASALEHQATMLALDRRAAERRAQSILGEGQSEIAKITLEGGQRRAAMRASAAARGVAGASVNEAQLSSQLIQDIEVYHVNVAAVREANAARAAATEYGNRALFSRTSAANMRGGARVASPEAQLLAGAAGAGISALDRYSYRRR